MRHATMVEEGASPPADRAYRLGDLLLSIRRNWVLVLLGAVGGGGAGYLVAADLPDRYAAEATLISHAGVSDIAALDNGAAPSVDPAATTTIVDTLGAPVVLDRVMDTLEPNLLDRLVEEAGIEVAPAGAGAGGEAIPQAEADRLRRSLVRRHLADNLEVANSGRSYVISVRYGSQDAEVAAAVANAAASSYLVYRSELKYNIYTQMLGNLGTEINALQQSLLDAERTAQSAREQVRLLAARSEAQAGRQQEEAVAEGAELYAQQREAEREAEAMGAVYERLLFNEREIQSRIGVPEFDVQLFALATVPLQPSGFNLKPVLLVLSLVGGFLVGTSLGLLRDARRRAGPLAGR